MKLSDQLIATDRWLDNQLSISEIEADMSRLAQKVFDSEAKEREVAKEVRATADEVDTLKAELSFVAFSNKELKNKELREAKLAELLATDASYQEALQKYRRAVDSLDNQKANTASLDRWLRDTREKLRSRTARVNFLANALSVLALQQTKGGH